MKEDEHRDRRLIASRRVCMLSHRQQHGNSSREHSENIIDHGKITTIWN